MAKLVRSRNVANKLWNAARFLVGREPDGARDGSSAGDATPAEATLPERWIRSRLAATTADATRRLDRLDLGGYAAAVTEFAWSDLCDWYLEVAKVELRDTDHPDAGHGAWRTGLEVFRDTLALLHPVMPFVTEEIWDVLSATGAPRDGRELLMTTRWPAPGGRDPEAEAAFDALAEVVRAARTLRTEAGVPAGPTISLHVAPASAAATEAIEAGRRWIEPLARVRCEVAAAGEPEAPDRTTATALGAVWLDAGTAGVAGPGPADQAEALRRNRDRLRALLADPGFTSKAPDAVIQRERDRLADVEERLRQLGGTPKDAG
jgi:valyl-tRNA synthetase